MVCPTVQSTVTAKVFKQIIDVKGKCALCGIEVSEESFEADHMKPWSKGGRTIIANGQILCSGCNHSKSNKYEEPEE